MKIVVINDLSLNVNLFNANIVLAVTRTFLLMELALENSVTLSESNIALMLFRLPSSGFPFRFGVNTVDSIPLLNFSWKNSLDNSYFSLFAMSLSMRL